MNTSDPYRELILIAKIRRELDDLEEQLRDSYVLRDQAAMIVRKVDEGLEELNGNDQSS